MRAAAAAAAESAGLLPIARSNFRKHADQLTAALSDFASEGRRSSDFASDGSSDFASGGLRSSSSAGAAAGLVVLVGGCYLFKDQIAGSLVYFSSVLEDMGPAGNLAYMLAYVGLEVLAVPAVPLTMTAGVLFGPVAGSAMVSVSATAAAAIAFLLGRYIARDRVAGWVAQNPKFKAIDDALGEDSFRVVFLLRLSPLLPFAASNYLYGLTSVKFKPYVLGSWLGMMPGTVAYVLAGSVGKAVAEGGDALGGSKTTGLLVALGATTLAMTYISRLVKKALAELDVA